MINIFVSILITSLRVPLLRCSVTTISFSMVSPYLDCSKALLNTVLNLKISLVYVILITFILLGVLLYYKKRTHKFLLAIQNCKNDQETQNTRDSFSKQQIEALDYESKYIITHLHNKFLRLLKPEDHSMLQLITEQATGLEKYFHSIFAHLKNNLYLSTNWISTDELLEQCFDTVKSSNIYHMPYVVINLKHLYIRCDIERIKNLIINSLYSCKLYKAIDSDRKNDIYIYINDAQLGYRPTLLEGKIQKVNAISFTITTVTQRPVMLPIYKVVEMADGQIVDNTNEKVRIDIENQHIVNAHYGYGEITYSGSEITYLYVIPINVQKSTKVFADLASIVYAEPVTLDPISMAAESVFLEKINQKKMPDLHMIMDALRLIKIYYTKQKRKTGEPSYLHPIAVSSILLDITENSNLIISGLVHDVVKNTPITQAGLTTIFGNAITQLILTAERLESKLLLKVNNYHAYIKSIINATNHNAILLRLADMLHNMRTIYGHSMKKQIEKAMLMEKFYIPLAETMQLTEITHELQLHTTNIFRRTKIS